MCITVQTREFTIALQKDLMITYEQLDFET